MSSLSVFEEERRKKSSGNEGSEASFKDPEGEVDGSVMNATVSKGLMKWRRKTHRWGGVMAPVRGLY